MNLNKFKVVSQGQQKSTILRTKIAYENWESKYRYNNETPVGTAVRCAKTLASIEKEPEKWYKLFLQTLLKFDGDIEIDENGFPNKEPLGFKATLGGRITANIGTSYKNATLMNCFINGPVSGATISYNRKSEDDSISYNVSMKTDDNPDDLSNIFLTILEQAKTLASEGGYGINFGFIRPRGSIIKGTGIKHPGIVSYMKVWDAVSDLIVKGDEDGYIDKLKNHLDESQIKDLTIITKAMARKGAMLAALPVSSPDIEEFIRAKQVKGVLTKFNISVLIDDKFMNAVIYDDFYDLHFKGKTYKRVKAVELYDLIMTSVYNRAEPGALFYDNMHKSNPVAYLGHCDSTNPCIIGKSRLATIKGLMSIEALARNGKDVELFSYNKNNNEYEIKIGRNPRKTGERKIVWKLTFKDGSCFVATPTHEIYLQNGEIKQLQLLVTGDKICTFDSFKPFEVDCVAYYGLEDVYNITVDDNYNYIVITDGDKKIESSGIVVKNCGEVPGLSSITTVCLLGSLNLTQYVFIENDSVGFNWEEYIKDISIFARMLDNVNDIANAPLPSYEYVVKKMRQFGMGISGLGSTLMMLGMPYNSKQALEFTKQVCELKENHVWQASAMLAKEKGTFEAYNAEKFQNTDYFKSDRLWDKTKLMIKAYGVRNCKSTTAPPLGNSSMICDNVSNGIEPVFLLEYERKVICKWPEGLTTENVKDVLKYHKKADFEYWRGEYSGAEYYYEPHNRGLCEISVVRDYGYQWLLDNFPKKDHSQYLTTTKDLSIHDHIAIQKVVQYYCNQSVSKTCNVPKDYSFEDFKKLYINAWLNGLVGFTAYRDDCMESVISSFEKTLEKETIIKKDIKLPEIFINGPTRIIKREGIKFYIHFSYLPEDTEMKFPICLWLYSNSREFGQTKICNRASRKLAHLALEKGIDSNLIVQCVSKAQKDYSYNRLGRMVSLCLRHNVKREDILIALVGIEGDYISSLLTAVRKFIALTLKDGTHIKLKCGSCGSTNTIIESGCTKCVDCGSQACGG
jgi:ribonucleotide reductase alpha subunit